MIVIATTICYWNDPLTAQNFLGYLVFSYITFLTRLQRDIGRFLKGFDAREFFSLQELKRRSASRREVSDSRCNASCGDGGHGIATGNDSDEIRVTIGECLRQCLTALTVKLYFKQTYRTVPKHHSCMSQLLRKLSDGSRSDIQPHPVRRDITCRYYWILPFIITGNVIH